MLWENFRIVERGGHLQLQRNDSYVQVIPRNGKLLRIFSLDPFDKVAKRFDFHSTTSFFTGFFYQNQTSLDSLDKVAKRVKFLLEWKISTQVKKSIVKSRSLAGALGNCYLINARFKRLTIWKNCSIWMHDWPKPFSVPARLVVTVIIITKMVLTNNRFVL